MNISVNRDRTLIKLKTGYSNRAPNMKSQYTKSNLRSIETS